MVDPQQRLDLGAVEPGYSLARSFGMELSFGQLYETDQRLRSGSFGTVYTCRHRLQPEATYAVKILDRRRLLKKDDDAVFREVDILQEILQLSHPHVVRLIDFFVEEDSLYMVQDYAPGGDVFDRLSKRKTYHEKDARELAQILLEAVRALHGVKPYPIIHRDLKPENLLLQSPSDDTSILLADFGFARHVQDKGCQTRCGTPAFVAPEILLSIPYKCSVDLWSVGCLLYMLIGGYPPFAGKNHRDLFRKVRAADFVFHDAHWKHVSIAAKQLISNLLTVRVDKRWTAAHALQSPWFRQKTTELSADLSGSITELKKFRARRSWRVAKTALGWATSAPFWNPDAISFSQQLTQWDRDALQVKGGATSAASSPTVEGSGTSTPPSSPLSSNPGTPLTSRIPKIKFANMYTLKTKLRKGSYATVWECQHLETKETFAVKVIQRKELQPKDDEAVLNEVAIMQSLMGNKYVVQLLDFYEEEDCFYIVMEYMTGGDVFDRIVEKTQYTEKDARDLTLILLKAVSSLHQAGIAHRDLKPQNLLLESKLNNARIKLGDFGFARRVHTPESLTTRVGTPTYVAPEILKNIPHDQRVDMWSVGVIIYVLLVGYPPFLEDSQSDLFLKIRTCDWKFMENDWKHISKDAKALIKGLLVSDPKERWSMREALRCSWIQQDPNQLSSVNLSGSLRGLRHQRNRLRSLAKAFIWMGKDSRPVEAKTQAQDAVSEVFGKGSKPPGKHTK
jgi:calcium/calmodulin-dependent protein kinase I